MKHHLRGWKRDHEDERDYRLSRVGAYFRSITIPPSVNLAQGRLPRVEDQGQLGSCVANASTSALEYLDIKSKNPVTELSQLFAYYACRVWVEKQQANADEGCEIRDMMKKDLEEAEVEEEEEDGEEPAETTAEGGTADVPPAAEESEDSARENKAPEGPSPEEAPAAKT